MANEHGCSPCKKCGTWHVGDDLDKAGACPECRSGTAESKRRQALKARADKREADKPPAPEWKAPEGFDPDKLELRDKNGDGVLIKGPRIAHPDDPPAGDPARVSSRDPVSINRAPKGYVKSKGAAKKAAGPSAADRILARRRR